MKFPIVKDNPNAEGMFKYLAAVRHSSSKDEQDAFAAALIVATNTLHVMTGIHPCKQDRDAMRIVALCMAAGAQKMLEDAAVLLESQ